MPAFVETILVVFALIAIGFGAAWVRLIRSETGDGLSDFVFTIAVPLLLFRTIATASFDHGAPWALWLTYFTAVLVTWTMAHLTIRKGFGRDARSGVVAGVTAAFSNLVLLGIPFISGLYGEAGLVVLAQLVTIHLPIMMAASIILYQWALRRDGAAGKAESVSALVTGFLRQLFSNPLIIGILGGSLMRFTGFAIPGPVDRVIASLAGVAGPVALFAMGVSLYGYGIRGQVRQALSLVSLKLFLMPAVALGMALAIGLPEFQAKIAVAAASLPAGVNSWLIASRLGTGQRLASTSMTIGTALAALTTGIWLAIAEALL
ncbi:putative permease [Hoeflea phototrophica DFL-43]|jgi:predicted permease|uniref:Putative permease n=1 Tax=Hoeflea phototrophica (strain DSM 17068 / NCIMB 14078 / DFL-43) TaxID=411684 RepID=A9DHI5_HOEPD|nr:AEC family transporter [Hoeflea phototrophica]EDQ31441.1 putative permease [Hoeflea phototrophica DFL-43]